MATAVSVLRRAPLTIGSLPGVSELLEEAARLVGYKPDVVRNRSSLAEQAQNQAILAKALAQAELQPLTRSSVVAYKARLVKEAESKGSCQFVRAMHGEDGECTVVLLGLVAWINFGIQNIALGCMSNNAAEWLTRLHGLWACIGYGLVAIWTVCMVARHKEAVSIRASWNNNNDVSQYSKPIPEFAIADMVALKKALPETTFFVEEFRAKGNRIDVWEASPVSDPFLVANYKGVCVYLDVWDEPRFEGRRTV